MKFKCKPFVVDAIQWTGDNIEDVERFLPSRYLWEWQSEQHAILVLIERAEEQRCRKGDWIIRSITGQISVMSNWHFMMQFQAIGDVGEHAVELY